LRLEHPLFQDDYVQKRLEHEMDLNLPWAIAREKFCGDALFRVGLEWRRFEILNPGQRTPTNQNALEKIWR
jgi:hypothetical protein